MRAWLLIVFATFGANGQPCPDHLSVDLIGGKYFSDNSILKDGITYPPKYVYNKNVSGVIRQFGCICKLRKCISKCCEMNSVQFRRNCTAMPASNLIVNDGLVLHYKNAFRRKISVKSAPGYSFVYEKPCEDMYLETMLEWYIQEDGSLYVEMPGQVPPFNIFNADKYCVDTFVFQNESGAISEKLDALICYAEDQHDEHYIQTATCMLISCVFILATCAVYGFLPELRNLHGRVLLAYLICLFVGFVFLATMQILILLNQNTQGLCLGLTFIIYFSLLSAFFWLNVMCFDIWWTFSGNRGLALGKLSKRGRFNAYAAYAFGIPSLLTILLASLEFSDLSAHWLLPMISMQGCFLSGTSKLIYLYGPIVILCCANMTFFVLTALKIAQIKEQTSVLKSGESSTHDHHRNDKQRLSLYVKLFVVMGINWILEVASACYPKADNIWRVTDAYNVLIGVPIFVIFVFKRKIFHLLKKRMRERLQRRQSGIGDLKKFNQMHNKRLNKYGPRVSIETLRSTIYITDSDGSTRDDKISKL